MKHLIPLCAGLLAVVLLIIDIWPAIAGTPQPDEDERCSQGYDYEVTK